VDEIRYNSLEVIWMSSRQSCRSCNIVCEIRVARDLVTLRRCKYGQLAAGIFYEFSVLCKHICPTVCSKATESRYKNIRRRYRVSCLRTFCGFLSAPQEQRQGITVKKSHYFLPHHSPVYRTLYLDAKQKTTQSVFK